MVLDPREDEIKLKKELINKIKERTLIDKKDLLGKIGKLFEEGGELASKILPYQNQFATTHKFFDKTSILEEIADCMLVLVSMIYDDKMNISYEQLEEMIERKLEYWTELQFRELNLQNKQLPYEIHITVPGDTDICIFREACKEAGVKPILLDLQMNKGGVLKDLMTSSVYKGDNGGAIREVEQIADIMNYHGVRVIRKKVETVPWHPSAPSNKHKSPVMPKDCYFECHFGIVVDDSSRDRLSELVNEIGDLHLSRNIFKKTADGKYVVMSTYRCYDGVYEDFKDRVAKIKGRILEEFEVEKEIIEFSVYDTKVKHDSKWLEKSVI